MMNLKSAVKSFQDLELLYSYSSANLCMLGLSDQYDARMTLEHYVAVLQSALGWSDKQVYSLPSIFKKLSPM